MCHSIPRNSTKFPFVWNVGDDSDHSWFISLLMTLWQGHRHSVLVVLLCKQCYRLLEVVVTPSCRHHRIAPFVLQAITSSLLCRTDYFPILHVFEGVAFVGHSMVRLFVFIPEIFDTAPFLNLSVEVLLAISSLTAMSLCSCALKMSLLLHRKAAVLAAGAECFHESSLRR